MNPIPTTVTDVGTLIAYAGALCALCAFLLPFIFKTPEKLAAARKLSLILVGFAVTAVADYAPPAALAFIGHALAVVFALTGTSVAVAKASNLSVSKRVADAMTPDTTTPA